MTIKQAEQKLAAAGITTAHLDALVLAELASGQDRASLLANPESRISNPEFEKLIKQRATRVPVAHLTGTKEFYGLEFIVSPNVLSPRPESEKIVELAIKHAPRGSRLIDVGTGCGALAIAIGKHRPDLKVTATDISPAALKIAQSNVQRLRADIRLIKSDLLLGLTNPICQVVVANLPYLKDDAELTPEAAKEPRVALAGGADGLDLYRKLFEQLPRHLAKPGFVFIESDPWQQPELIKMASKAGLKMIEQDYFVLGFSTVPRSK